MIQTMGRRVRTVVFGAALLTLLAGPVHGAHAPKMNWTPGGPVNYGDPDPGGSGIEMFRLVGHSLSLLIQQLSNPTKPITPTLIRYTFER